MPLRPLSAPDLTDFESAARREWLSVNGLGGFASGTVSGAATRRYHALLIAALPPPHERMALLSKVDETVTIQDQTYDLSSNRYPNGVVYPDGWRHCVEFTAYPVPTWTFRLPDGALLVRRVYIGRGKNTVYVTYTLREASSYATLTLTPLVCWKSYHSEMHPWPGFPSAEGPEVAGWSVRATPDAPLLRMTAPGARWTRAGWWHENIVHDREAERGQDAEEDLYCPAIATLTLRPGQTIALTATIEDTPPLDATLALAEIIAHQNGLFQSAGVSEDDDIGRALALGADLFLVDPPGPARHTIIAGYPWFTDWGRDTMIALEGLCLCTGRPHVARDILLSFAKYVSGGMIPNRFPDAGETPDYNTVDATLWFVHACGRYIAATADKEFQKQILPTLEAILAAHIAGTRYDIRVDPEDGLLRAGEPGSQLTWMDAKVGDWVFTPRIGKPVEICALWINALRTVAHLRGAARGGKQYADRADRAQESFRSKFVRPDGNGLYDLIHDDGTPDAAIRPNQAIAAGLPYSPITDEQAAAVVSTITRELLTPYGLRTLSPSDPAYRGVYAGDQISRDGSYHQGTVWPWPLGSYVDALLRTDPAADIPALLAPLLNDHLCCEYGIGGIAEIFDGDAPHRPDGCPWQAWSIAEVIRARFGPPRPQ